MIEGEIPDGMNRHIFKTDLQPGGSVWDEVGEYRLKKCPFCGEYPDWTFVDDDDGGFEWLVHCRERTCHVKPTTSWTDAPEFAALKWNRRFNTGRAKSYAQRSNDERLATENTGETGK